MQDRISVRQICIILVAYNAVLKLLLYPSSMASACGNALIFPALFNLALQTAVVWSVAFLSSKTDNTFFGLLEDTFGNVAARIVFAFFALYFLLNAVVPLSEEQLFVHDEFYDTIPSLVVFLPFFIFSVYAGSKAFNNAGRCADVCLPIFILTMICLFAMTVTECDFSYLLPVLKQPFKEVAGGALSSVFRFADSAPLLMFMGHYKYKKGDCAKITASYAVGGLIVALFMTMFYAVYGELAPEQPFALGAISIFFSAIDLVGRIDLFALYALNIVVLFAIVLNIQLSRYCLEKTFNTRNRGALSLALNAVLLIIVLVFNYRFTLLQNLYSQWFWIGAAIFAYLIPLLAWTLRRKS